MYLTCSHLFSFFSYLNLYYSDLIIIQKKISKIFKNEETSSQQWGGRKVA